MKEPKIIIVAATCWNCNNLIAFRDYPQTTCNKCGKRIGIGRGRARNLSLAKRLSFKQTYQRAKEYDATFHKSNVEESVERLGTFATVLSFKQYKANRIARHPDGTPNFEEERKIVSWLRRQTYKKYDNQYSITEGDIIRGIVKSLI